MAKGNAPTPIETKMRQGNPGHQVLPQPLVLGGRVKPGDPFPKAPDSLSPEARRVWRNLVAQLIAGGIYDRADATMVETAAGLVVRLRQARRLLDDLAAGRIDVPMAFGKTRRSSALDVFIAPSVRGMVRNPVAAHEAELSTALRLALTEIGLSPAGRTRVGQRSDGRAGLAGMRETMLRDQSG